MITIRLKIFALDERTSLCVICTRGIVRKSFRAREEETFCRRFAPNGTVPFAMRDCTGYVDRRAPDSASRRQIGFFSVERYTRARRSKSFLLLRARPMREIDPWPCTSFF
jgi:hypothetical protein